MCIFDLGSNQKLRVINEEASRGHSARDILFLIGPLAVRAKMHTCVRRRNFITILGGIVLAPFAAGARQARSPVVGFLSTLPGSNSDRAAD
jgi:hypothetical protein